MSIADPKAHAATHHDTLERTVQSMCRAHGRMPADRWAIADMTPHDDRVSYRITGRGSSMSSEGGRMNVEFVFDIELGADGTVGRTSCPSISFR